MPTDYSGSGVRPTLPLSLINDGEIYNFDSLQQSVTVKKGLIAKLMDWISYLDNLSSGSKCSTLPAVLFGSWTATQDDWINYADGSTGSVLLFPLALPNGRTLTAIGVTLKGASHSALPAVMPSLKLLKADHSAGGSTSQIGSTTPDPTATFGALDAAHFVSITGLTEVIDNTKYRYVLQVTGESSTNSHSGLQCYQPIYTVT